MKTWKLVSGIISIVLFAVVAFQSCAASFVEAVEDAGGTSGGAGMFTSLMLLAGGIVSVVTSGSDGNGGNIARIVLFGIGALAGFSAYGGAYGDLFIWAIWCMLCAIMAIASIAKGKKS